MKTKELIYKILNLEKGEGKMVFLPLLYSFFAGASLAFFVTSSTALFLNIFERDMLSVAFIAAGIIVWLVGQFFSFFQKKVNFTKTLTGSIGFLLISIIIFIIFFFGSKSLAIIFIIYAWIRVFSYIHAVSFWGMAGRLFSLRQGKRVFGLISGGEVVASIISFFSVPFLLKLMSTEDLLMISGISLFIGFLIMLVIVKRNNAKLSVPPKKADPKNIEKPKKKTSFLQNRYYKLFFVIAFIPIFAQFFIDFIFQAQAKIEYPEKESLTAFVGIFFGISSVIEFILKTFISGRLMAKFGMKFGLLAFPLVLVFSVSLATAFGFIYGALTLFFAFVALGRLFTRAVRTAFNDPATQILFQPLPSDERISFQNKVESGPKAFASVAAGILLFLFAKIPGFSLVYFSAFLLLVILFWAKSAVEIYKEYRSELQSILLKKKDELGISKIHPLLEILQDRISSGNWSNIEPIIRHCRLIYPYQTDLIITQKEELLHLINYNKVLKFNQVIEFSKSELPSERIIAARRLSDYSIYKIEKPLIRLLHDENFEVKCEAIISAGRMKETDLFYHLVSMFQNPALNSTVSAAMVHIGEAILTELYQEFQKTEFEIAYQLIIIELIEKIGGERAVEILRHNVNHPNYSVSEQIIKSLGVLQYQSSRNESILVWQKVENEIKNYVYIASVIINLSRSFPNEDIIPALEHEKLEKKRRIFSLLSVLYDPLAVKLIADNLESTDKDSKGFALEIADIIFSEIHKPMILPLLESEKDIELVMMYKPYFPMEKLGPVEQLIDILNTEYWLTGLYIKAYAIKLLSGTNEPKIIPIHIVNIVHPHPMLRQLAAYHLFKMNKALFDREVNRNSTKAPGLKEFANEIELYEKVEKTLIFDKLKQLKRLEVFAHVAEEQLIEISTKAIEIKLSDKDSISFKNDLSEFIIVVAGEIKESLSESIIATGNILCPYFKPEEKSKSYLATRDNTMLLRINIHLINKLLTNNMLFARSFVDTFWNNKPMQPETNIVPILTGIINDIK